MPVTLVSREGWNARDPKNLTPLVKGAQKGTAVHYTGMDSDEQSDHRNCAGRVRNIQNYHMDSRGWADIAYSYVVCKHGSVFVARGVGIRTAAQGTTEGNDAYHAICFLGDDTANRDDVTDAGRAALSVAIWKCNNWTGVLDIEPHSHFHATECPGDQLRAWIKGGTVERPETPPTPIAYPPWPGRYLKLATPMMHGNDVRTFQTRMKQRGWYLAVDGYYGPVTRDRVVQFQRQKRLSVDGIVGPSTWRAVFTLPVT
jgi:hypothetical protein